MTRLHVLALVALAIMVAVAVAVLRWSTSPGFFVVTLSLAAVLCALGLVGASPWAQRSLRVAGGITFLLGLVGLFTVGLPLLVSSVLLLAAAHANRPAKGATDQL